jgi:hypothetical protein
MHVLMARVANMFGLVIIFLFFFMYFDDFSKEVMPLF